MDEAGLAALIVKRAPLARRGPGKGRGWHSLIPANTGLADGTKGPMGIKDIASWLNAHEFRNRSGKPYYTSMVHDILTRTAYPGTHYYNTCDSRTRRPRPKSEWIAVPVPAILSDADFNRVQELLHSRRPNVTSPRITNSEVLLSGLVRCESCGSPMMIRTGTGHSGKTYRYYTCAGYKLKGSTVCGKPISVPELQLDELVVLALAGQLLTPARITELLNTAIRHRRQTSSESRSRKAALEKQRKDIEGQIERLITAIVENTLPDMTPVRAKIDGLNTKREECVQHLAMLKSDLPGFRQALSKQQASSIADSLRRKLLDAPPALKKRYVRGLVSEIVVPRQSRHLRPASSDCRRDHGSRPLRGGSYFCTGMAHPAGFEPATSAFGAWFENT